MRVVHDHQEWLTAIDALKPAGNSSARRDPTGDRRKIHPVTQARSRCGEDVQHVDPAHHRGFHWLAEALIAQIETQPIEAGADVFGAEFRFGRHAVKQYPAVQWNSEPRPRIVPIHHGPLWSRSFPRNKKQPLRRCVLFHGSVKVKMIAREVRENGRVEMESIDPAQRERVRGDLRNQMRAPALFQFRGEAHHVQRFRSGVGAGRASPASLYSMVPIRPVTLPASRNMASIRYAVVVLPLVPVIPVK